MTSNSASSNNMVLPIGNVVGGKEEKEKPLHKAVSSILTYLFSNPPFLPEEIKSKDVSRRHTLLSLSSDDPEDYLVTDCYPSSYDNTPTRSIELLRQLIQEVEQMNHSTSTQDSTSLIQNPRFRSPERDHILAAVDLGKDDPILTLILRLEGDENDFKNYKYDNLLPCDVVPKGWHDSIEKVQITPHNESIKSTATTTPSEVTKARSYSIVTSATTASNYSTASAGQELNDEDSSVDSNPNRKSYDVGQSYDDNFVRRRPVKEESVSTVVDELEQKAHSLKDKEENNNTFQQMPFFQQRPSEDQNVGGAEYYTDPKDFWAGTEDDSETNEDDKKTSTHETEEEIRKREKEEEDRYWAMYDNQKSTIDQDETDGQDDQFVIHGSSMLEDLVQNSINNDAGREEDMEEGGQSDNDRESDRGSENEDVKMEENVEDVEDDRDVSDGSYSQDESEGNQINAFNQQDENHPDGPKPETFSSTDTHYGEDPDESFDGPMRPKFSKSSSFIVNQIENSVVNIDEFSDISERGSINDHDTITGGRTPHKSRSQNFTSNSLNGRQIDEDDQSIRQEEVLLRMNGGNNPIETEYIDEEDDRFNQEIDDSIQPLGGYRDRPGRTNTPPSPSLHPSDTFLADGASDASMSVMRSSIHERQKPRSTMLFQLRSANNNRSRNGGPTTNRIERIRNSRPTREAASTTQQAHRESVRIGQRQRDYADKIKHRNESIKLIIKGAWKLMGDHSSAGMSDGNNGGLERMNENDFLRLAREAIRECVD